MYWRLRICVFQKNIKYKFVFKLFTNTCTLYYNDLMLNQNTVISAF